MHELSIAQSVVEVAEQAANGRSIVQITLEIGELAGVSSEALLFCFDLATQDTLAEGAGLEICALPGIARCQDCQKSFPAPSRLAVCECGSCNFCFVQGEELNIRHIQFRRARQAGKKRLAGDTTRSATSNEGEALRRDTQSLKEVVADQRRSRPISRPAP